jgi:hypothetical protein
MVCLKKTCFHCLPHLDDRAMPYHPIDYRDNIDISKKFYYAPIFYLKDNKSLNQDRAHLWQEAYIYLSKTPKPNLSVKLVPLPNLF